MNLSSKCPIKRFAKEGTSLVPMAVPPFYRYSLLSYLKLFIVRTRSSNLHSDALVGFSFGA